MNKREVIAAVAERSGVNPEDCARVLDSFEDVFTEEITGSKWKNAAFEQIYGLLSLIKEKENNKQDDLQALFRHRIS